MKIRRGSKGESQLKQGTAIDRRPRAENAHQWMACFMQRQVRAIEERNPVRGAKPMKTQAGNSKREDSQHSARRDRSFFRDGVQILLLTKAKVHDREALARAASADIPILQKKPSFQDDPCPVFIFLHQTRRPAGNVKKPGHQDRAFIVS